MESKGRGGQKHTKKTSLLLKFLFEEIQKEKDQKHKRATCSLARDRKNDQKNNPSARTRARQRERGGTLGIITLHTHNTRFHHGTQTNLETVHLQNDRVRAFIKPSERCANVQHRHRGVEIRELARVVRSYKLVLPIISVLGELPFVVFGNTFFCFLSLSSVFLSLCDAYISYAYRVNESEGDEFGRMKRERKRERKVRECARVHSSSR